MTVRRTLHPLAESYLVELERLLGGIEPAERFETLEGVREHIEAATAGDPGDVAARAALAGLGSPHAVADEAYAGRAVVGHPAARPGFTERGGLAVAVALLQALAVLLIVVFVAGAATITEGSTTTSTAAGGTVESAVVSDWSGTIGAVLPAFFLASIAWVPAVLLACLSALWTSREKLLQVALVPASAVLMGGLPELGYLVAGIDGVPAGAWVALLGTVFGSGWLIVTLTRRGRARAA